MEFGKNVHQRCNKTCHYFVDVEGIGIGGDVNIEVIQLGFGDI
jgi:hypothetical protein